MTKLFNCLYGSDAHDDNKVKVKGKRRERERESKNVENTLKIKWDMSHVCKKT